MKTKHKLFKLTSLFALLLTFLAFAPSTVKAQPCPLIENNLNCRVDVQVDIYYPDWMGTCTKLCTSYVIQNMVPGQVVPVNCSQCPQYCDIVVTVILADGMAASGSAGFADLPPGNPITGGSPCLTATAFIAYFPGFGFRLMP